MNPVTDTLVWLANFPAQHGYAMVFIAAFSLVGFGRAVFGGLADGGAARLRELRTEAGHEHPAPNRGRARRLARRVQRAVFTVLALIVVSGGVIGVLSLSGVQVTEPYIHEHGIATEGVYDGTHVTFTATDGNVYVLPLDFFTSPVYPGDAWTLPYDEPVPVIYLESHPQAFVVDASAYAR